MARIERTEKPVGVLLKELGQGVLGLPEIQRGYVWNRTQARDLLDSLYREYPSGLILLWKPNELPELRDVDVRVDQSANRKPDFLILDGQQRLTSLKKIFDGEIQIYFNVKDETFQIYNPRLKTDPFWVLVKEVLEKGAVEVWVRLDNQTSIDKDISKVYLKRLSNLEKIKDYSYPVIIVHTDDYEEVTELFIRLNSMGTRLREAELAMARLALRWSGALVREFETALTDYEQIGFFLEPTFLMRCFVAVSTGQCRFRFLKDLWEKSPSELESIWQKTKYAIDYTINFLKYNAGIESSDWIPSINALIPLIFYFSKKDGQLTANEAKSLLFWFFEATIHARFSGSPETRIDQDLRAIESNNPIDEMIANLRKEVASFDVTTEMIAGKYQQHSFMPLIFTIFKNNRAEDWFTGTILSSTNVGPAHQIEIHHIFPKALLRKSGDFKAEEIDDIANIAFLSQKANRKILTSKPEDYLKGIEKHRLEAQLIPLDQDLWRVSRFRDFIRERRELIAKAVNDYLRNIGAEYFSNTKT